MTRAVVKPSLLDALIPVILLISMLAGTVYVFGLDSFGPNLVALIISAAAAALIGIKNGLTWTKQDTRTGARPGRIIHLPRSGNLCRFKHG